MTLAALLLSTSSLLWGHQATDAPLTNQEILELLKAGVSEEVIQAKLTASGCVCDSSTAAIVALKEAGASKDLILAVVGAKPAQPDTAETASPAAAKPAPVVDRPGGPLAGDVKFKDIKYIFSKGDKSEDRDARLTITHDSLKVLDKKEQVQFRIIPFPQIEKMVYEKSAHPRWKTAILVSPLFLISKGKKHWLTVQHGGEYTILKLDKNNYREILAALEARTGHKIEWIIED